MRPLKPLRRWTVRGTVDAVPAVRPGEGGEGGEARLGSCVGPGLFVVAFVLAEVAAVICVTAGALVSGGVIHNR